MSDPLYVLSFIVGVRWGAVGVAFAFAVTIVVLWLPTMSYAFRVTTIEVSDLLRTMYPPAVLTAIGFAAALAVVQAAPFDGWINVAMALVVSLTAVGVVGYAWPHTRRDLRQLVDLRSHLKRSSSSSEQED